MCVPLPHEQDTNSADTAYGIACLQILEKCSDRRLGCNAVIVCGSPSGAISDAARPIAPAAATGGGCLCPQAMFTSRAGGTAMRGSLGEKIGEGAYADVHAWAPGRVLKLFKSGFPRRHSWW